MLHRLSQFFSRKSPGLPERPILPAAISADELCRRIHRGDIYGGFPFQDYSIDLQGWNSESPVFRRLMEELRPSVIVELGTWKGGSALHLCELADELGLEQTMIVCVDTWLGGAWHWIEDRTREGFPSLACAHGYPRLYAQFLANVMHLGQQRRIVPLPNTTEAAAEILRESGLGPIDLLYIDASHTEEAVYADLKAWWPLVRVGGIVFGDDFIDAYPGVERAVRRFAADQGLEFEVSREKWIVRKRGRGTVASEGSA
jgi:predicted O-methyltransferase YrrM